MTPLDADSGFNSISVMAKSHLQSIGGWMRFIAIVYIIFLSIGVLGAIGFLVGSDAIARELNGQVPAGVLTAGGIFMLTFLAVGFYTAISMLKAGEGFRTYATTNNPTSLEKGFINNKTYWLIMGVLTIITLVLVLIGGIAAASYLPMIMSGMLG